MQRCLRDYINWGNNSDKHMYIYKRIEATANQVRE